MPNDLKIDIRHVKLIVRWHKMWLARRSEFWPRKWIPCPNLALVWYMACYFSFELGPTWMWKREKSYFFFTKSARAHLLWSILNCILQIQYILVSSHAKIGVLRQCLVMFNHCLNSPGSKTTYALPFLGGIKYQKGEKNSNFFLPRSSKIIPPT